MKQTYAKILFIGCYLEETFGILQDKDAAVGEVWLLRHFGTVALHVLLCEDPIATFPLLEFTGEVVSERCGHPRPAPRVERIENQDARSGK